jgi:hypothetical protein
MQISWRSVRSSAIAVSAALGRRIADLAEQVAAVNAGLQMQCKYCESKEPGRYRDRTAKFPQRRAPTTIKGSAHLVNRVLYLVTISTRTCLGPPEKSMASTVLSRRTRDHDWCPATRSKHRPRMMLVNLNFKQTSNITSPVFRADNCESYMTESQK